MRKRFRLYRRQNGGRYYLHDEQTGRRDRLPTTDRATAQSLLRHQTETTNPGGIKS